MEWHTTESGKYRIESLSASTFPGALKVIKEAFCQDEPVSIGSEVNKNPAAAEELLELCADAALDGVSLVAVEIISGEVVAALFNKLQTPALNSSERTFFEIFAEQRCKEESSSSLIQFMANVDERCNLFQIYDADCSLELMFLATLREYRFQNLAKLLCEKSLDLAKRLKDGPVAKIAIQDLGPKYADMNPREITTKYPKICQAIWTGKGSQKIGNKLGFTVHIRVSYEEFVYNGKTYAERLGSEAQFCEVVAKVLY